MSSPAPRKPLAPLSRNSPPGTTRNPQPAKGLTSPPRSSRRGFVRNRSMAKVSHRRSEVTLARWPGQYPTPEEEQPELRCPMQGTHQNPAGRRWPHSGPLSHHQPHVFFGAPEWVFLVCFSRFCVPCDRRESAARSAQMARRRGERDASPVMSPALSKFSDQKLRPTEQFVLHPLNARSPFASSITGTIRALNSQLLSHQV